MEPVKSSKERRPLHHPEYGGDRKLESQDPGQAFLQALVGQEVAVALPQEDLVATGVLKWVSKYTFMVKLSACGCEVMFYKHAIQSIQKFVDHVTNRADDSDVDKSSMFPPFAGLGPSLGGKGS